MDNMQNNYEKQINNLQNEIRKQSDLLDNRFSLLINIVKFNNAGNQ